MTTETRDAKEKCERCCTWGKSGFPCERSTIIALIVLAIVARGGAALVPHEAIAFFFSSMGYGFLFLLAFGICIPVHYTVFRDEAGRDHLHRERPTWGGGSWLFFANNHDRAPALRSAGTLMRFRISGLLTSVGTVFYQSFERAVGNGTYRLAVVRSWDWKITVREPEDTEIGGLDWHGLLAHLNDHRSYRKMVDRVKEATRIPGLEEELRVCKAERDSLKHQRDFLGMGITTILRLIAELRSSLGQSKHAAYIRKVMERMLETQADPALVEAWQREAGFSVFFLEQMKQVREAIAADRAHRDAKKERRAGGEPPAAT